MELLPDLPLHGSTQMSIHNLNGVLELQKMGFKRVVLARELSINEIEYICKNSEIEIECFIHGALCISYSGQCLFSSIVGGRSGNRGKCAGPCRLPYELLENDKKIDSGYLLNSKDLCGLDYIPSLIKAGVSCLKIEGRMKSPEYVAIVTKIYRKYIDLASSNKPYIISSKDRKELLQAFNRGNSSSGHLNNNPNKNLIFKEKPNNMGLFLGKVEKYNKNKGYITIKLKENINIGDTISFENETKSYTISELMENGKNITDTKIGQTVTIGRIKGDIKLGNRIFKISSKNLLQLAKNSYKNENRKILLNATVNIKKSEPISINITPANNLKQYQNLNISYNLDFIPEEAKNKPLDKQTVINQIIKTASTPYDFKKIKINLDENIFLPQLSILNKLRRNALEKVEQYAISKIQRELPENSKLLYNEKNISNHSSEKKKISLLLNILNPNYDYSKLENVDNVYIPLKYFSNKKYEPILKTISDKFETYIYMPTIIKGNYKNLFYNHSENAVKKYNISGFVISNLSTIVALYDLFKNLNKTFKIVANYTFNVFNNYTVLELKKLGINAYTLSPELDKFTISSLSNYNYMQKELIVYGKTPLMNMNYCLLR